MNKPKMILEIAEGIATITFNNPEKHNAVSLEMWESLGEMMDQLEKDDKVRVVVLKGAGGKSFVSGADISKFDKDRSLFERPDASGPNINPKEVLFLYCHMHDLLE